MRVFQGERRVAGRREVALHFDRLQHRVAGFRRTTLDFSKISLGRDAGMHAASLTQSLVSEDSYA